MLMNKGRYMISQTPSKKTQILYWIWYDLFLIIAIFALGVFLIMKLPFELTTKISLSTIVISITAVLFAQIDELGGSPLSIVRKTILYYIRPKRFLFEPRKQVYDTK